MKKFFLIIALGLAVVSSLVAGIMAAYPQTMDIGHGKTFIEQFSLSSDESETYIRVIELEPGDSTAY